MIEQPVEQFREVAPFLNLGAVAVLAGALLRMGSLKRQVEHHEEELRRRATVDAFQGLKERLDDLHHDVREIRDAIRRNGFRIIEEKRP